jgi:glycosyltransferase involved in cell wall biosynthesis
MKKLLLISYYYPPANFVGGHRTASWAKYLHESGYYPIVITRHWNEGQTDLVDKLNYNELEVEQNGTHEVHRLPYKRSLRDRCSEYRWLKPFQKALTLFELIASNFSISALPYANFHSYCCQLIKKDPTISIVIASGRPFQSFAIGHQLKKDFPNIHWIPDYRDEWTTFQNNTSQPISQRWLTWLDSFSEKRWLSNASLFLTVSENWAISINHLVKTKGAVVLNGFDSTEPIDYKTLTKDKLVISYVGTLYPNQNIEVILDAAKGNYNIHFQFIGIELNCGQKERIESYKSELSIEIYPRMPKQKLYEMLSSTDLYIISGFMGVKGWYPVKMFEYYNWKKPILLCPSDNDVMEKFILETGSGFVANNTEECITILQHLIKVKQGVESLTLRRNEMAGEKYSRRHQTKVLGGILEKFDHCSP